MTKTKETVVETKEVAETVSAEKAELLKLIERYKVTNPVKYAIKKDALQKQLEALK